VIDQEQAVNIARERAAINGWAFAKPLEVVKRRGWFGGINRYEIESNVGKRGGKVRFVIDAKTGKIISEGYVSR
jgi:uncharacterized membrane protein YkoI